MSTPVHTAPNENQNLHLKSDPVTAGPDATVTVWILCTYNRLGFNSDTQIIFGTVYV